MVSNKRSGRVLVEREGFNRTNTNRPCPTFYARLSDGALLERKMPSSRTPHLGLTTFTSTAALQRKDETAARADVGEVKDETANGHSADGGGKARQPNASSQAEEKQEDANNKGEAGENKNESLGERPEAIRYPGGTQLTLLTLGLCLTTFVVALDNTIIAAAIPRITTVFDSLNDVGWYGSSYLLTTTSLQPSFGKVYTYFDVKWVFLSALLIFELGSILCAAAKTSVMLIVGRAVAGAGAAALFSGSMTIIGYSVPLRRRAIYTVLPLFRPCSALLPSLDLYWVAH